MDLSDIDMNDEDTYKAVCSRIVAYFTRTFTTFKVTLERADDDHVAIIKHILGESRVIFRERSYALIFFRFINTDEIPFIKKDMSLEEIELQLQIRGY